MSGAAGVRASCGAGVGVLRPPGRPKAPLAFPTWPSQCTKSPQPLELPDQAGKAVRGPPSAQAGDDAQRVKDRSRATTLGEGRARA